MAWPIIAVSIGLALINAGVQYWRARKAEEEARQDVRVGGIPQVTESGTIPVVFGTVRLQAPNVVFRGDLDEPPGGASIYYGTGPDPATSTRNNKPVYRMWLHQVWCQGPVDKLEALMVDGKRLGTFSGVGSWDLSGGVTELVTSGRYLVRWEDWDMTEPPEADKKHGTATWIDRQGYALPGLPTQHESQVPTLKEVIRAKYGSDLDIASYRGVFSTFFRPIWSVETANLAPITAIVRRIYQRSFGESQWQPSLAEPTPGQMNPAHIIREIITDRQWGRARPESVIDEASFLAAAQTLHEEGFGISCVLDGPGAAADVIRNILEHIDGALYEEPTTGKLCLRLVRADYTIAQLPIISPADIIGDPQQSQVMPHQLVNEVSAEYVTLRADRARSMTVHDTGAQILGPANSVSRSYPYVQDPGLVGRLLTRDLRQLGLPLSNWELVVTREAAADLRPGDVFVLNYPDYQIEEMVLRIKSYTVGTLRDSSVRLECIEDAFAFDKSILGEPDEIVPLPQGREPAPLEGVTFDLPLMMVQSWRRESDRYTHLEDLVGVSTWQWGVVAEPSQEADLDWALYESTEAPADDYGEFSQIVNRQPFCLRTADFSIGMAEPLNEAPRGGEVEMFFDEAVESFGESSGESVIAMLIRPGTGGEHPMFFRLDDLDYYGTEVYAQATFGVMGSTAPYDSSDPRVWLPRASDELWVVGYVPENLALRDIRRIYAVDPVPRERNEITPIGNGASPSYVATSRTVLRQYEPDTSYPGSASIAAFGERLADRPYPPAGVVAIDEALKEGIEISWLNRNRLSSLQLDESSSGGETPEDNVSVRVRIYDGSGQADPYSVSTATLIRTLSVPATSQSGLTLYPWADEEADRGSASLADVLIIVVDAVRSGLASSHRHHVIIDRRP